MDIYSKWILEMRRVGHIQSKKSSMSACSGLTESYLRIGESHLTQMIRH